MTVPVGKITADITTAFTRLLHGGHRRQDDRDRVNPRRPGRGRPCGRSRRTSAPPTSASSTRRPAQRAVRRPPPPPTPTAPSRTPRPTRCCRSSTTLLDHVLTGGQFKSMLEQQWQTTGGATRVPALGLSNNVNDTTTPPARRRPDHRVRVNGVRWTTPSPTGSARSPSSPPAATISAASRTGEAKDTGLVDRDLWVGYLKSAGAVAPTAPARQVQAKNMKASVSEQEVPLHRVRPRPDLPRRPCRTPRWASTAPPW